MFKERANRDAVNNIMGTFTGADGGVAFIKFITNMEEIERENSESGKKLLKIMRDFSHLICLLQIEKGEPNDL